MLTNVRTKPPSLSRRSFSSRALVLVGAIGLSVGIAACGSSKDKTPAPTLVSVPAATPGSGSVTFDTQVIVGDHSPGAGNQDPSGLPTPS
jgi:hypothetical protein